MIISFSSTPQGRLGALLSALIIVCSAIGLTMHRDVYAHRFRRDFYRYYTNVSNLLVLVYFALAAPVLHTRPALQRFAPTADFCVAMAILLTGTVFHFMIFPAVRRLMPTIQPCRETHILAVNNLFVHYIVPWLTFFYWLLCSPDKHTVPLYAALLWTLLPLGYVVTAFQRGRTGVCLYETEYAYPYPFLDVQRFGMRRVLTNCLTLFVLCVLFSGGLLLLMRLGHALSPIAGF